MDGRTDVTGSFEGAWDHYWRQRARTGAEQPDELTRRSVPILRAARVRRVIDLGCGIGGGLCYLLREGFAVTGVDRSSVAIDLAREALVQLPNPPRGRGRISRDGALGSIVSRPMGRWRPFTRPPPTAQRRTTTFSCSSTRSTACSLRVGFISGPPEEIGTRGALARKTSRPTARERDFSSLSDSFLAPRWTGSPRESSSGFASRRSRRLATTRSSWQI